MNDSFESDERKRKETIECLYWSLMNGWDIPKELREHYGFSEDYELPQRVGTRQRGIFSFSEREYPPYTPKRKDEGSPPRPPTLQVWGLKSCSACGIRCGVHGFAMNLLQIVTCCNRALLREARVTLERRQTAYRMQHC